MGNPVSETQEGCSLMLQPPIPELAIAAGGFGGGAYVLNQMGQGQLKNAVVVQVGLLSILGQGNSLTSVAEHSLGIIFRISQPGHR